MSQTQLRITILRVDCTESELDAALVELARDGLVREPSEARLTMAGLAVAVATIRSVAVVKPVQRARSAA